MKRANPTGRIKGGQAMMVFLVVCMIAISAAALYLVRVKAAETAYSELQKSDSTYVKKLFPYNRYSNEVLMY